MRARLAAVVILASATAGAVDFAGRARAAVNGGVDTNPRRDFISPDAGGTPTDGMLQGIANLAGSLQGERVTLNASYDVGARKFIFLANEDTIVQSLQLDGSLWLGGGFALGFAGRARDRRGAERDYTDLVGELNIQYLPDAQLDFRVWGAAHRFIFWVPQGFRSSFYAPEGGLTARYRFNKRHSLSIAGNVSFRTYNALAYPNPKDDPPETLPKRSDFFALASVAYWYRGPVVISLSYGYLDSSSNSYGESLRQHRVGLVFGAPLFWSIMAMLDINLRFALYPDGIYVSPEILTLDEGGENLTSGVLKLVRPFGDHFEIEARYGLYYGRLPKNDFTYWRHVVTLGAGVRF